MRYSIQHLIVLNQSGKLHIAQYLLDIEAMKAVRLHSFAQGWQQKLVREMDEQTYHENRPELKKTTPMTAELLAMRSKFGLPYTHKAHNIP
jgi:hypothetical protein